PPVRGFDESWASRAAAVPRLIREVAHQRRTLGELQGSVLDLELVARSALAGGAFAVGDALGRARRVLDDGWEVHMSGSASLPAVRALQRTLGRRVTSFWDELEPSANRPGELVWRVLREAK